MYFLLNAPYSVIYRTLLIYICVSESVCRAVMNASAVARVKCAAKLVKLHEFVCRKSRNFAAMMKTNENIYPVFDRMLSREDKESLLGQKGVMLWFTGLSGSGKTTVALALERELHRRGLLCRILDGDNIRTGINANLGFSEDDRKENIRRIAEVGKLFVDTGIITIASFISPTRELREMARDIIGADDFKEIYISTSLEACEARDVKGLYARARRGEVKNFTGISAPFEAPEQPALSLDTAALPLEESVRQLLHLLGIES